MRAFLVCCLACLAARLAGGWDKIEEEHDAVP